MNSTSDNPRSNEFGSRRTTRFAATSCAERPAENDDDTQLPDLVGNRYELCNHLAYGGMGVIFQARDLKLERDVAVKVLRNKYRDDSYSRYKFENEARVMSFLPHPGLPPIYDSGACSDGRPFHVMKLIQGVTLSELLKSGTTSETESFKIFSDVCETMAFAHSHETIHLDLKPDNIMVGAFGEVHVMDWGLARIGSEAPGQSVSADDQLVVNEERCSINGTPEYMAPEQARGDDQDARTDVFGLGAILCEILTGQAPYRGRSLEQVFRKAADAHLEHALKKLAESDADHSLIRLARQCLQPRMSDRLKDAVAVAREVERFQESALERARSDMSRFFELTLDLFCIAGLDGYFRRINSNFVRILGHSEKDLLSRPFLEFVHPEDRSKTVARVKLLQEGKPVVRFRNRYLTAEGSYITLEWTSKAIEGENIIFAVARDVTPRARAEKQAE